MRSKVLGAILALFAAITVLPASAQQPTLKSLAADHGSLVAGDVTIANFHAPKEFPSHFLDVIVPDEGDNVAVSANVRPDGNVDLVFTAIDPATGAPTPMLIDAGNGSGLPADRLFMTQYDVVVTNPHLALHAVDRSLGPGTTANGATGAFNFGYTFTDIYSGAVFGMGQYSIELGGGQLLNINSWTNVPGAAPIPATYTNGLPATFGDYSGAKLGNEWGLGSGPWGGVRTGAASLDSMTITLILAPAVQPAPGTIPGVLGFSASSVFLTSPAPLGGENIALSASPGIFNGQHVTLPASATVPEGATSVSYTHLTLPTIYSV